MFDLKLVNGRVLDGTGRQAVSADVGIVGDRIADVGDLGGASARREVDAGGSIVCPGFIDAHSHSDAYLLIEPSATSKIFQGVTTEVIGNCGSSAAPRLGAAHIPSDWQSHSYPGTWRTVAEYRALLEQVRPAVNVVALTGHNVLRASVMGYEGRAAREDEVQAMARLLERSLKEGSHGLSTGLIYPPGMYAAPEEILVLAGVVAEAGGIYSSHMRSESAALIEALTETLAVGRQTGVRVQVSHLKTSGRPNWHLVDGALGLLEGALRDGVKVAADRYPYTSSCTDLDVIFPHWATEGGRDAELQRLRDPALRARLREEILAARSDRSWGAITVGSTSEANARFRGLPLERVAEVLKMEPVDAALYLIETDHLGTSAFFQGMNEANMWRILEQPYVMIGSDASLRAPSGPLSRDYPHPRAYGSFPRFLRAAIDGHTVPVEEAVRKMTSLPAGHFGLGGRGLVTKGQYADLVVFDPTAIRDLATYSAPHQLAEGVTHVVVNGVVTIEDGAMTEHRAGRWL